MLLAEALEKMTELAVNLKDAMVAKGVRDLKPTLIPLRDGLPIAIGLTRPDGDVMLRMAACMASGFDADLMSLIVDAWSSPLTEHPLTGESMARGDLARLAAEPDTIAKGWVSEGLEILVVNRADDITGVWLPYTRRPNGVDWLDPVDKGVELISGAIPEGLLYVMSKPHLGAVAPLPVSFAGLSRAIRDVQVARHLSQRFGDIHLITWPTS